MLFIIFFMWLKFENSLHTPARGIVMGIMIQALAGWTRQQDKCLNNFNNNYPFLSSKVPTTFI